MKRLIVSLVVVMTVLVFTMTAFACNCGGKGKGKGDDKGGGKYAPDIKSEVSVKT